MEEKNNCPMDPFLENSKEQDEEVFNGFQFTYVSVQHCEPFRWRRSRVIKSTCLPSLAREGL